LLSGGLASDNPTDVRRVAVSALDQYAAMQQEEGHEHPWHPCQHAQSRRFCDPKWRGLDNDDQEVPLRPYLERLAAGKVHW